jgi:hypothetical protein
MGIQTARTRMTLAVPFLSVGLLEIGRLGEAAGASEARVQWFPTPAGGSQVTFGRGDRYASPPQRPVLLATSCFGALDICFGGGRTPRGLHARTGQRVPTRSESVAMTGNELTSVV